MWFNCIGTEIYVCICMAISFIQYTYLELGYVSSFVFWIIRILTILVYYTHIILNLSPPYYIPFLRVESIVYAAAVVNISYVMTHLGGAIVAAIYTSYIHTQHSPKNIPLGLHHMGEI